MCQVCVRVCESVRRGSSGWKGYGEQRGYHLQSNLPHFIEAAAAAAAAAVQLFPAYSCNFLPYRSAAILPREVRRVMFFFS